MTALRPMSVIEALPRIALKRTSNRCWEMAGFVGHRVIDLTTLLDSTKSHDPMRTANIISAIVMVLWLGLALSGRDRLKPFLVDDVADWPTMANIDSAILFPMLMATALLAFAWVCNASGRWPIALLFASFGWFVAILPYLAIFGGGV